jgi:carbamoyltransferase
LNIIGISAHFHDASCCLLRDGELVAAASEEAFTRVKHDARLPSEAFRYCLAEGGLDVCDVDVVAYYEDPRRKLERQLWMGLPQTPPISLQAFGRLDPGRAEREIREILGFEGRIWFGDHHRSHAASAYYFSGFDSAAILCVDAVGEWASTSFALGRGAGIATLEEVEFPHSLGMLYSAMTSYLGFEVNEGEYKVMGLAPYGSPTYLDEVRRLVVSDGADRPGFRLQLDYFDFMHGERMFSDRLCRLFGRPPRPAEGAIEPFHCDVAKSLQHVLEELLLEKVRYLHARTGMANLCMAGGVALNCVANGRILREGPFARLFVQPAASDAGSALGAAALAHAEVTGRWRPRTLADVYLGPATRPDELQRFIADTCLPWKDFRGDREGVVSAAADRLAAAKVVGWFQGRMEFGPRALGARSILADPRHPGMRDRVNSLVKKREAFRPFAPAILEGEAGAYFDLSVPSPFMLFACQVRVPDLPAITHVDGSARVQTVSAETNPRFHALLTAFRRRTGCPVLLNTSFNVRGEPIVCSPGDAVASFLNSGLDSLVIEDFLLDRHDVPERLVQEFRNADPRQAGLSHSSYTLF